jgi:hypothetical protein
MNLTPNSSASTGRLCQQGAVARQGAARIAATLMLTGIAAIATAKPPDVWPQRQGANNTQCEQALQLARLAFRSPVEHLFAPLIIPEGFPAPRALWTDALDLSGGDALEHDEAVFQKIERLPGESRGLYWQKEGRDGRRLVVLERPLGWRGDQYYLYALLDAVTPEQFRAARRDEYSTPDFPTVLADTWRAPQVFRDGAEKLWVLHQGEPYWFLGPWQVFVTGAPAGGPQHSCTIHFRPQAKGVSTLLPREVRTLAKLLESTLGTGEGEGTLQPTARISMNMRNVWANVLFRPWATIDPYNTAEEVNAGLKEWAARGPNYCALHARLMRQKPRAERALAASYRARFGLTAEAARAQAAFGIDTAFRSGFVFSSSRPDKGDRSADANPWR